MASDKPLSLNVSDSPLSLRNWVYPARGGESNLCIKESQVATVPEGAIVSYIFDGRLDNQQFLLTSHWKLFFVTFAAPDPDYGALANAAFAVWDTLGDFNARYLDCLSHDASVADVIFQVISPTRLVRKVFHPGDGEGHVIEDALPPNVSHVITLQTDIAVPRVVGNKHIGAVPVTGTLGGEITDPQKTLMNTLAGSLISDCDFTIAGNDYSLQPVMLNKTTPADSKRVFTGYTQTTTRVERRRTVGLGS